MLNRFYKTPFLIISLILLSLPSFASNFSSEGLKIIESSSKGIILEYSPIHKGFKSFNINNIEVSKPIIKSTTAAFSESGAPIELAYQNNIVVPNQTGFRVTSVNINNLKTYAHFPAPFPTIKDIDGIPSESYIINDKLYNNHKLSDWVSIKYAGLAGFSHLAQLKIMAARFNPNTMMYEIPESITISIQFDQNIDMIYSEKSYLPIAAINSEIKESFQSYAGRKSNNDNILGDDTKISSDISSGNWIKIGIETEGIYKIDASSISSMGYNISAEDVSTIKIFGKGGKELSEVVSDGMKNDFNEQPIIVNTNSDGSLSSIIFYAAGPNGFEYNQGNYTHYINHYSTMNYYMLTWGGRDGLRAAPISYESEQTDIMPTTYYHYTFFEEELINPFPHGSGRQLLGRQYFSAPFVEKLHNLVRGNPIYFRFMMAHRADNSGYFNIYEQNNLLGKITLPNTAYTYKHATRDVLEVEYSSDNIASDNRCVLSFDYRNTLSGSSAVGFFDFYEIGYEREFVPINNEIGFFSPVDENQIVEYNINGFSGNDIYGFYIAHPGKPQQIKNLATTGNMFVFKFAEADSIAERYFISSNLKSPMLETADVANLRRQHGNTKIILITDEALIGSAEKYKEYREQESNMEVTIVLKKHIYNEFAGGVPDITAIRDFLIYAYHNWETRPEYLILWGDGHYDYRNIVTSTPNYIPPYETLDDTTDFLETYSYPSDDFYAKISGDDDLIDINIGRLTIDSPENGHVVFDKIKHYEQNSAKDSWQTRVILLADDGPVSGDGTEGPIYTNHSESISENHIPEQLQKEKIYLIEYPTENIPNGRRKPRVTQDLISSVNTHGALIVNWIGHGSPNLWAHEHIFERATTIPQMTNYDKLFFNGAATCDFGRFDMIDAVCGAEDLLLSRTGGSIGVFSAARVVYSSLNRRITEYFYDCLLNRDETTLQYPTLGQAYFKTKQRYYDDKNHKIFFLLGDPTMKLLMPENIVRIDSINGINFKDLQDTITLKALSKVKLSASIINSSDSTLIEDFIGKATINMVDGSKTMEIYDDHGYLFRFIEQGGALNKSAYPVTNGKFEAEFVIPKDISFSNSTGKLFTYAYSEDDRFANGVTTNFKVYGIDTTISNDGNGPEISIYLDSRDFYQGKRVSSEPLLIVDLFDQTGINSTGLGIGHRIEAWIDGSEQPINLTEKFQSSIEDPRYGTVQNILYDLDPGIHTIKLRAWDVYNNYSTSETYFNITPESEGIFIENALAVPNPSKGRTNFSFTHNASPPYDAVLSIYNLEGQLIYSHSKLSNELHKTTFSWDGLDNNGRSLSTGVYYFQVTIHGSSGVVGTKSAGLSVIAK